MTQINELRGEQELIDLLGFGPMVIEFWADWCAPCKQVAPHFKKAAEMNPEYHFASVDIMDLANADLVEKFEVMSIPTIIKVINKDEWSVINGRTVLQINSEL